MLRGVDRLERLRVSVCFLEAGLACLLWDTFTKNLPVMPSALIMEGCVRADIEELLEVWVSYLEARGAPDNCDCECKS
jgi:hypothetical protein